MFYRNIVLYSYYICLCQMNINLFAFNVSPNPNSVFQIPYKTSESSYFGYSIVLREDSIFVGAPRANDSQTNTVNSPGAIFNCPLETADSGICRLFSLDYKDIYTSNYSQSREQKWWTKSSFYIESKAVNNSYLGATMDGGPRRTDPLIICAPLFGTGAQLQNILSSQGTCFWMKQFSEVFEKPFILNDLGQQVKFKNGNESHFVHILAEMGFSAKIIDDRNLIMGAPGVNHWAGGTVVLDSNHLKILNDIYTKEWNIDKKENLEYSYNGYAVSAGHLNGSNYDEIFYVATAPHGKTKRNSDGLVYIFDMQEHLRHVLEANIRGYGEYFGYAVQVEDVDNDTWDDILVGAPLHVGVHSNCTDCSDVGVVYLYKNTAKDNYFGGLSFEEHVIKSPFGSEARFGSSIAKLGDINMDGYNDIAIGAPFAYGTGAVAIYFGSENGLKTDPSAIQILKPSEQYQRSMFGFVISRGVDTDRNGYNDLAIGAPLSESVFYYRAYPVVELVVTINSTEQLISLDTKELTINICYKFKTKSRNVKRVNIFLNITLDEQYRRFRFLPLNSSTLLLTKFSTTNIQCDTLIAQNSGTHIFKEIPMNVKISLVNDAKNAGKEFCSNCVAASSDSYPQQVNTSHIVYFDHKCNGSCKSVDLSITHATMPESITFGLNKSITVHYEVINKGGLAFQPQLTIETNPILNFKKSMLCSPFGSKVVCDLNSFENEADEIVNAIVTYEVSDLIECDEILITANVGCLTLDAYPADNNAKNLIRIHRNSILELLGKPRVNSIELNNTIIRYDLEYKLELANLGPSKLKNANLAIMLPYQFYGNNFIQLNESNIEIDHQIIDFTPITRDLVQQQNQTGEHFLTEGSSLITEYKLNPDDLKIWDCHSIDGISCLQSNILFGVMNPGEHKIINLKLRLSAKDIKKSNTETWLLKLNASFTVAKRNYSDVITKIMLQPIVIHNYEGPEISIWIWILSAVIGLFWLSILTWFLVRKGFFKRQTKEAMKKRMDQEYDVLRNIRESFRMDEDISHTHL